MMARMSDKRLSPDMGWALLRDVCALAAVFIFIGSVLIWGAALEEMILTARGAL